MVQQMQLIDGTYSFFCQRQSLKASVLSFFIHCCRVTTQTTRVQHFILAAEVAQVVKLYQRPWYMHAGSADKKQFRDTICRKKTVGSSKRIVCFFPLGLPLSRGVFRYSTLRDLSSHDQDRGEGKVGREEAAVPKGPLPI